MDASSRSPTGNWSSRLGGDSAGMNLDELRLEILINTESDEVGLWEIWREVRRLRPTTAEQQKADALDALSDLLDAGYIKAGQFGPLGWAWWDKSTSDIIDYVD